jgi:hypothetical protein
VQTNYEDIYWDYIRDPAILRRAAQIVAIDSSTDFQETGLERQIFSFSRDAVIDEIRAALDADRYIPEPKTKQAIPKSNFSQRPGSVLSYRDRVVCQAILMCIAPPLDALLPSNVWSWRLKASARGRNPDQIRSSGMFRETDISKFPFLKKKTVRRHFDVFSPWYRLWPQFDRITTSVLRGKKFKFMVVSDIAGYFENIELGILDRLLSRHLSKAPRTINLLMDHFGAWVDTLYDGSRVDRGIPQGNSISSFVGNFYLKPVDDEFVGDARFKYFRYVDDIRILAESADEAREAALKLEDVIRGLKLNLQTAKTKVVTATEGLRMIHDSRLDELDQAQALVRRGALQPAAAILDQVRIANGSCVNAVAIKGSSPPLADLNLRVFRRWAGLHLQMGSPEPIRRMCKEAQENANFAVLRDLEKVSRAFPERTQAANIMWRHILGRQCDFPMQEAELVRILRYFNYVPNAGFAWACDTARDTSAMPYLRMQSVFLLSRSPCFWPRGGDIIEACLHDADTRTISAGLIAASLNDPARIRRDIQRFERLIQYIRSLRRDPANRNSLLAYIFSQPELCERRLYEFSYLLRFIVAGPPDSKADYLAAARNIERLAKLSSQGRALIRFLRNV